MNVRIYGFCLLASLMACNTDTAIQAPQRLIPKDTMVLILKDVHLAEAASSPGDKSQIILQELKKNYGAIFNKYHLDSTRFSENLEYYLKQPELMVDIYQEVLDSLNKAEIETR